jgi:PKD repeat protein
VAVSEKVIPYFPIPNRIDVEAIPNGVCEPVIVQFNNSSYPLNEQYDIRWDFGDGNSSSLISPAHTYEAPGIYDVSLRIISPIGCRYEGQVAQNLEVLESPVAAFRYTPLSLNQINNTANFFDLSEKAEQWDWDFGASAFSNEQDPTFAFPDTGQTSVELVVTHENGCTDSTVQIIDIVPEPVYFLPNAFRPAGQNKTYRGNGKLDWMTNFEMNIYDRWGGKVFTSTDPRVGWNGRVNNSGNVLPAGVYICRVQFTGPRGNNYSYREFATLLR